MLLDCLVLSFVAIFLEAKVANSLGRVPAPPGHGLIRKRTTVTNSVPAISAMMYPDGRVIELDVADIAVLDVLVRHPV